VKATATRRWSARCPAHQDRRASLAIRELDDGRVLVHDFAGCATADILAAIGLDFDALFPDNADNQSLPGERRPFSATDVLRAVAFEALVVATAAASIARGKRLSDDDRARLKLAAQRLQEASDVSR
jgi:hypothetical protein